jgi:hypothetical protein
MFAPDSARQKVGGAIQRLNSDFIAVKKVIAFALGGDADLGLAMPIFLIAFLRTIDPLTTSKLTSAFGRMSNFSRMSFGMVTWPRSPTFIFYSMYQKRAGGFPCESICIRNKAALSGRLTRLEAACPWVLLSEGFFGA